LFQAEFDPHLKESESPNRRNGKATKTVQSTHGSFELATPRDRAGSFEPQLVKKRQTVLNESVDQKILALFGLGMSYADISEHLEDLKPVYQAPNPEVAEQKLSELDEKWGKLYPVVIKSWRSTGTTCATTFSNPLRSGGSSTPPT
jgi:putative transposase